MPCSKQYPLHASAALPSYRFCGFSGADRCSPCFFEVLLLHYLVPTAAAFLPAISKTFLPRAVRRLLPSVLLYTSPDTLQKVYYTICNIFSINITTYCIKLFKAIASCDILIISPSCPIVNGFFRILKPFYQLCNILQNTPYVSAFTLVHTIMHYNEKNFINIHYVLLLASIWTSKQTCKPID